MRAVVSIVLLVAACGSTTSSGTGEIVRIDADRRAVELRRDDLPGMSTGVTIRAAVPDPALLGDLAPGAHVTFEYTRRPFGETTLVRLVRAADVPLLHDHTPHHGGVVAMVGTRHVEAAADAAGAVRVWLTDFHRRPLPLAGVHGVATVGDDERLVALAPADGMLAGHGPPIAAPRVVVRIALSLDDGPLAAAFTLPIASDSPGVASVAQTRCRPGADPAGPRCGLAMSQAVSALAISPDGATLVVAVVGGGVSIWRLPEGTLVGGIEPAPPATVPAGEQAHPEIVGTIAWRPDGREIALVMEGRLLRYALPGGRLVRALSGPGDVVRDVAWSLDGSRLVVTTFHSPEARVLDADTGRTLGTYPVELEGAAVAVEPGGETVVVGSEAGTITRFRALDGARLAGFAASQQAVVSLARIGGLLAVLTMDGVVRAFDATDGRRRTSVMVGFTPTRFATGPGDRVAVGLPNGKVAIIDPHAGAIARVLDGPATQILAIAWRDGTLVTGDAAGRVALWDVGS